jgi:predicted CXXCH cytochrome family protein
MMFHSRRIAVAAIVALAVVVLPTLAIYRAVIPGRGVTCFSCHDPYGSKNDAMLREPSSNVRLACHGLNSQNGPHVATIEQHTHHAAGSAGQATDH